MLHHHTSLVSKCSAVQKISSGQTFTALTYWAFAVTLSLNAEFQFLPQDTPAFYAVLSNQVGLQTDRQFRRYSRNSHIWFYKSSLWPWHWRLHGTPPHDNTPPYQVWLKTVERFRRHCPDKIGHTDRRTDGQTDRRIPISPSPFPPY